MFHFEGDAMVNLLYYGRLWRVLGLDRLIMVRYCANYSKYNFVERRWGNFVFSLGRLLLVFNIFCVHVIDFLFCSRFLVLLATSVIVEQHDNQSDKKLALEWSGEPGCCSS